VRWCSAAYARYSWKDDCQLDELPSQDFFPTSGFCLISAAEFRKQPTPLREIPGDPRLTGDARHHAIVWLLDVKNSLEYVDEKPRGVARTGGEYAAARYVLWIDERGAPT
jgi:hypothetical protein